MSGKVLFQDDALVDAVGCQELLQLLGPVYGAEVFFFSDMEGVCYLLDSPNRSCISLSGPAAPSVEMCVVMGSDCDKLCAEADGAAGVGCCAAEGCNCSDNSFVTCEEDHYFCPELGICASFSDEETCKATSYCCV